MISQENKITFITPIIYFRHVTIRHQKLILQKAYKIEIVKGKVNQVKITSQ